MMIIGYGGCSRLLIEYLNKYAGQHKTTITFHLWRDHFEYYYAGIQFGRNYVRVKLILPIQEIGGFYQRGRFHQGQRHRVNVE